MSTTCLVEGCEDPAVARKLCSRDYQRAKTRGTLDSLSPNPSGDCAHCSRPIPKGRRWGAKFCSTECKQASIDAANHELMLERRATNATKCGWCQQTLLPKRFDQRFCSRKCADDWKNDQTRLSTLRAKRAVVRPCLVCDEPIPAARPRTAIYCSLTCKNRADHSGHEVSRKTQINHNRRYLYGITPEQFAEMLAAQGNACAICRTTEPGGKGGWHVDHCHDGGQIRALLCHHCNLGLGHFKDDINRMLAAIAYLEAHAS